jgi:threonine aldolase
MFFASDNAGPAHPKVMESLHKANAGYASGYGNDEIMSQVRAQIRTLFEAPDAAVYLVATGTAANALLLATMTKPWETIFCADLSHVQEDECNAPEFYSGAKLTLVPTENAKMTPAALEKAILKENSRGVHGPQRGPVTLTQTTEKGTVYAVEELTALTEIARNYGLKTHMDGARFTNALVQLNCTPAEMTWKAGIDAVSFGGTKNGLMGVEACIIFDPALAWEFELRRKRGAHLLSKGRYLSAQFQAYLTDDLWRDMARAANAMTARLADGLQNVPDLTFLYPPQANIIFARFPRALHKKLQDAGAVYYIWDGDADQGDPAELLTARLVCDWSMTAAMVDQFLSVING